MIKILEKLVTIDDKEVINKSQEYSPTDMVEGIILDTRKLYLNRYPDLKVVSRVGVGLDNIDLEECKQRGIKIFTTPCEELMTAVAEFTIYLTLSLLRKNTRGRNLGSMTIGIIGFGRIGRAVEELLNRISLGIYVYDKKNPIVGKKFLLGESDIITIHTPGSDEVIGEKELEQMKDGSYLINTARAGCVDEKAVQRALKSKKLAGFASDVNDCIYFSGLGGVIITPHVASSTVEARTAMESMAVKNLIKGLKNARKGS